MKALIEPCSSQIAPEAAREELQYIARQRSEETLVILMLTHHLRVHGLTRGELQHQTHQLTPQLKFIYPKDRQLRGFLSRSHLDW